MFLSWLDTVNSDLNLALPYSLCAVRTNQSYYNVLYFHHTQQRAQNVELLAEAKPSEKRMKKMKAEMQALTKRLEEKSKAMQKQQNNKVK